MSASLRKFRALVFTYADVGSEGTQDSVYLVEDSGDSDQMWWCSKGIPSGRETTRGAKPEHTVDAVFGFAAGAPVNVNSAILCDGATYVVRSVLTRDYGRDELQVLAERVTNLSLEPS